MGQVKSKTDGNGKTTKYERNSLEQLTETIDPLERKTTRKYDAAGNLKELKDPEGRTTTYTYDPGDRLKEVKFTEEATKPVSYVYDKDGNVTEMKDATGTTKKTYDELDRLTEVKNGNSEVVKYKYDLGSQTTEIVYPNAKAITRKFDSAGRLEAVKDWLGGEAKFAYNRDSMVKSTSFPSASTNVDEYEFNRADELTKTTMKKGASTLASIGYERNSAGQLKSATQTGLPGSAKPEYGYDTRERMTSGAGGSYEYDAAGNATKVAGTTYSYDNASQLKEGGGVKFAFNNMGQRSKATPASGPATTYGWDQAGNLVSIKRPEEGAVAKIEDSFAYDGSGLRMTETINGTTRHLAWDLASALPLLLSDGTNYYLYGPDGLPFAQIASEAPTYLHHDQQGSTRLLTNSSGETKGTYTYTPYGATEGHTGTATTPLGYDGQYTSSDTGLIYLRARVYDPSTAQFMSVDPLVAETEEAYGYAGQSPVNRGDPSGLQDGPPIPGTTIPGLDDKDKKNTAKCDLSWGVPGLNLKGGGLFGQEAEGKGLLFWNLYGDAELVTALAKFGVGGKVDQAGQSLSFNLKFLGLDGSSLGASGSVNQKGAFKGTAALDFKILGLADAILSGSGGPNSMILDLGLKFPLTNGKLGLNLFYDFEKSITGGGIKFEITY